MGNKQIVKILMAIFAIRPIIDLFYNYNIGGVNIAGLVAILISALGLFSIALNGFKIKLSYPLFAFALYTLMITVINMREFSDIADWLRIFSSITFFFAVAPFITVESFMKYARVFVIVTTVPILMTFLQIMNIIPYQYYDWVNQVHVARATGGYIQPAVLTRFLVFGLLYTLFLMNASSVKARKWYFLYIAVNLIAVFFTYHRTSYLLSIVIIFLYMCFYYRGNLDRILPKLIAVVVVCVAGITILSYLGLIQLDSSGFEKLLGFDNIIRVSDGNAKLHLRGRGNIATQYLGELFSGYECILGFGKDLNNITGTVLEDADMDIIRILWAYGIIGYIIYLVILFDMIKTVFINTRGYQNDFINIAKIGLVIFIIFGFTMDTMIMPNFMIHVYMLVGLTKYRAWINLSDTRPNVIINEKHLNYRGE